jgi:hypothetical protein
MFKNAFTDGESFAKMYNKLPEAWKPYISNIDADYFK